MSLRISPYSQRNLLGDFAKKELQEMGKVARAAFAALDKGAPYPPGVFVSYSLSRKWVLVSIAKEPEPSLEIVNQEPELEETNPWDSIDITIFSARDITPELATEEFHPSTSAKTSIPSPSKESGLSLSVESSVPSESKVEQPHPLLKCEKEKEKFIVNLITLLYDTSAFFLGMIVGKLDALGKPIENLNPLAFFKVVLTNKDLSEKFKEIFKNPLKNFGWMKGSTLLPPIRPGFEDHFKKAKESGGLNDGVVEAFVREVSLSLDLSDVQAKGMEIEMKNAIQKNAWYELHSCFIEKI